jgi:hypothetical protein
LNGQGEGLVYLDGPYDLRRVDADDVLIWSVNNFTFSSGVTPSPGLVQVGYRLLGLTTEATEDFGTSQGLTGLLLGDAVLEDRYGVQTILTVGAETREHDFHSDTEIVTAIPDTLLVAAGLRGAFVRVAGRGERAPLVDAPDETAKPRNRRVEVVVR